MSRQHLLDQVVSCVGASYTLALTVSRWEGLKGQLWNMAPRLIIFSLFALMFLYSTFAPEKYAKYRPAVIAVLKTTPMLLRAAKLQVCSGSAQLDPSWCRRSCWLWTTS